MTLCLELGQGRLRRIAGADHLAVEAVAAPQRRDELVTQPGQPEHGLPTSSQRRDHLGEFMRGSREQGRLGVLVVLGGRLAQAVEDPQANRRHVLHHRAELHPDHVVGEDQLIVTVVEQLPRVASRLLGSAGPDTGRRQAPRQLRREAGTSDRDHFGAGQLFAVDLGHALAACRLEPLGDREHETGVANVRADHARERAGAVGVGAHHGDLASHRGLGKLVGAVQLDLRRQVLGKKRVFALFSQARVRALIVGVGPQPGLVAQSGGVHRERRPHRPRPEDRHS